MGYKRPETVYTLVFDHRDGLEVRAASVPVGQLLELGEMAEGLKTGDAKTFGEARALFEAFAKRLRSWNLEEDDGTPIPPTLESLYGLEFGFATEIVGAWFDALSEVSGPLGGGSTPGSRLELASIPVDLPTPNLTS